MWGVVKIPETDSFFNLILQLVRDQSFVLYLEYNCEVIGSYQVQNHVTCARQHVTCARHVQMLGNARTNLSNKVDMSGYCRNHLLYL